MSRALQTSMTAYRTHRYCERCVSCSKVVDTKCRYCRAPQCLWCDAPPGLIGFIEFAVCPRCGQRAQEEEASRQEAQRSAGWDIVIYTLVVMFLAPGLVGLVLAALMS